MAERYLQHTFPNGFTLLAEQMAGVQSAAMTLLVPAGTATDPADAAGSATVLSDLLLRGAGSRDSKQLTDHLDRLGLQRSGGVGVYHTSFRCAALSHNVLAGLDAYADIVRRPHLPADGFESARDLALQAIAGIDDDPRQKLLIKLREWHLPSPFGRSSMGRKEDLEKLTHAMSKADFTARFEGREAILAVAGKVDFAALKDRVAPLFADWDGTPPPTITPLPPPKAYHYEPQQSEQTHIGIAYPSLPETHADYYVVRLAMEVLSGGMSGRLFTEIREKRGLVYNVSAGYMSLKTEGHILGYAGTSNDRAQATLDTFIVELRRMKEGVTDAELKRAKTGLKASIIMQGESTSSRAGAIAHDWFMRGRLRTLDELKAAIDTVTLERVNEYLKANEAGPFTIVIVGPKELTRPA